MRNLRRLWDTFDHLLLFTPRLNLLPRGFLRVIGFKIDSSNLNLNFDFFRRFAPRCQGCLGSFRPDDLIRRAKNDYFHVNCFTCSVCHRQLATGDEFLVADQHQLVCKDDYDFYFQEGGKLF